jgi:hypothetical protein
MVSHGNALETGAAVNFPQGNEGKIRGASAHVTNQN